MKLPSTPPQLPISSRNAAGPGSPLLMLRRDLIKLEDPGSLKERVHPAQVPGGTAGRS